MPNEVEEVSLDSLQESEVRDERASYRDENSSREDRDYNGYWGESYRSNKLIRF